MVIGREIWRALRGLVPDWTLKGDEHDVRIAEARAVEYNSDSDEISLKEALL